MPFPTFDLIGVGNPIMDLLAHVPEAFLSRHVAGDKGGMVLVDGTDIAQLVGRLDGGYAIAPGGSAANATLGAARLGLRATYVGKIGGDPTARDYFTHFTAAGADGSRFKHATLPNGRCLSLVTPDGQRTMRTHLGAAMTLSPDEISAADFAGARHAHIEGYLMFNPALAAKVVASARAAGCTLSIDLSSFEVVNVARDWLLAQIKQGVDVIFANEDEIRALFESDAAYDAQARRLAGYGGIAAVKMGKDGAWIARGAELHRIEPVKVDRVVDTTGAGDAWAAGFLFGHLRGQSLATAGAIGSLLGAECVQHLGAAIPDVHWPRVRAAAAALAGR
ncbi:MAG TPA: adenosine kinase [Lacunisphaera sp.]|jgi:sugar/nucleoside kinase (ribokinase family)|nr:adenosine kinase [Lacunisphaera sp.]